MAFEQLPQQPEKFFLGKYKIDVEGFVNLGDIARGELKRQTQYVSAFADGLDPERPFLGQGLRFASMLNKRTGGATGNYHSYRIHAEDAEEFLKRVEEYYSQK